MPNLRLALVCALFLVAGGLPRMGDRHDEGTAHVVVIVDEFEAGSHLSEGVW